jgi:integrase
MPKRAAELTQGQINKLKPKYANKPTVYAVGGVAGLYWQITPSGKGRSWLLKAKVNGKLREIGLGAYPEVSLGAARDAARDVRQMIRNGDDPVERRRWEKQKTYQQHMFLTTFGAALEEFLPIVRAELSSEKYRKQWPATVREYAIPVIGGKPVNEITSDDVLSVLKPIWIEKLPTAKKLQQKLKRIFDYCKASGYCEGDNPAEWHGNLKMRLSRPAKTNANGNWPSLQEKDAPRFWQALKRRKGMGAEALRFQSLTATRSGAVRLATWDEFDLDARIWTVQPGRAEAKTEGDTLAKRVPLTDAMVEILRALPPRKDTDIVFWAPSGGALSDATLSKVMRTIHEADVKAGGKGYVDARSGNCAVPHGTRATFKGWVKDHTNFETDLVEAALWHKLDLRYGSSYTRMDMLERRRDMMEQWGAFLTGKSK